jgi:hypothetical protein
MAAFAKSWRRSPSKGGRCSISSCRAAISRCSSDFALAVFDKLHEHGFNIVPRDGDL